MEQSYQKLRDVLSKIPENNRSWIDKLNRQPRDRDEFLPRILFDRAKFKGIGAVEIGSIVSVLALPLSYQNQALYFPSWKEPVCLIRISYDFPEVVLKAAAKGAARIGIKANCYPEYPVVQFALWIDVPGHEPFFSETLADICDCNIQRFAIDLLKYKAWYLLIGNYDDEYEKQMGTVANLNSTTIQATSKIMRDVEAEIYLAAEHLSKIETNNRDFRKAMDRFNSENPPLPG